MTLVYRVYDRTHVYPIVAVEVLASNDTQARQTALEAMMGARLETVDADLVEESLTALYVDIVER